MAPQPAREWRRPLHAQKGCEVKLWILVGVLAGLGQLARAADLEALPVQRFTANR